MPKQTTGKHVAKPTYLAKSMERAARIREEFSARTGLRGRHS